MSKRRELTATEKRMATALAKLWNDKKAQRHFSQLSASNEMGFSSQSSISQYLNAKIPLNTDAKIKFAKFLDVKISDFDPDFKPAGITSDQVIIDELVEEVSDLSYENQMKIVAFAKGLKSAQMP